MKEWERIQKSLIDFKKMLEGRLTAAFDERDDNNNDAPFDELYENKFTLSFMGKTCTFYFGAQEYQAVIDLIDSVLEEM